MSDTKTVAKSNKFSRADRVAADELSVRKMRRTLMWLAICFWLLVVVAVRAIAVLILGIRLRRATEALGVTKKGTFAVVSAGGQLVFTLGFMVWAILLNSRIIP